MTDPFTSSTHKVLRETPGRSENSGFSSPDKLPAARIKENPDTSFKNKQRQETFGEWAGDRIEFDVVGFGLNELGAIAIGTQLEHGKNLLQNTPAKSVGKWFSKEGFEEGGKWLAETFRFKDKVDGGALISHKELAASGRSTAESLMEATIKGGKVVTRYQSAKNLILTASLLISGTMLMPVMKLMSDNANVIAKSLNHASDWVKGSKLTVTQADARDKEVEEAIAAKPHPSWKNLLTARLFAIGAAMGASASVGSRRMDAIGNFSENLLTKGKFSIAERTNLNPTLKQKVANVTGKETFTCLVSAKTLELTSKFTAALDKKTEVETVATQRRNAATSLEGYKKAKPQRTENNVSLAENRQDGALAL